MKHTLYSITAELVVIDELLEAADGDLSKLGDSEAALTAWFEAVGVAQAEKFDGYLNLIRKNEADAETAKREKDEYAAKQKAFETRAAYLKARLLGHMQTTRQAKVETAAGRVVTVVKNGGAAPVVLATDDPSAVPEQFRKVKVEIDKAAVGKALAAGEVLDFAELGTHGFHLRVK